MTKVEFLREMDDVLELPAGSLKGPEKLGDLSQWNSGAVIAFMALADTNNGKMVSPRQIVTCSTIDDLLKLAQVEGVSG